MKLTEDNYHGLKANMAYWSVSQFKLFKECEAKGLASAMGDYTRPETDALLMGSYVDAFFSGTLESFKDWHPEIFNSRTGELKAQYQKADRAVQRASKDPLFMRMIEGEKQKIVTGKLFNVPWKAKVDVLNAERIVDIKFMRDMKPMSVNGDRVPFIDAWGYDIQGYVYQQLVKQVTGKELPFYLAVITKEEIPDIDIIHIPTWRLNSAGEMIKYYIGKYDPIKKGKTPPERCGKCDYCRATKVLTKITEYEELLDE